jgi:cyclophilin family peptidyl-prolyl cis-trans isomerase
MRGKNRIVEAIVLSILILFAGSKVYPADEKGKETKLPMVTIETEKGKITFEMYPDVAPKTVARMTELIKKGFFDGLKFHRVVPGFVIQGGDPKGDGTGGSGTRLPAEFNKMKHVTGTVAMARAQDPNSADSQFYICLADQPGLDNQYTIFGQVKDKSSLEVIQKIRVGDVMKKVTVN